MLRRCARRGRRGGDEASAQVCVGVSLGRIVFVSPPRAPSPPPDRHRLVINICARPLHRGPLPCRRDRRRRGRGRRRRRSSHRHHPTTGPTNGGDRRRAGARGAPDGARRVAGSRSDYQLYDDRRRPCPQDVPSIAPVAEHVPPLPPPSSWSLLLSVRLLLTHTHTRHKHNIHTHTHVHTNANKIL